MTGESAVRESAVRLGRAEPDQAYSVDPVPSFAEYPITLELVILLST